MVHRAAGEPLRLAAARPCAHRKLCNFLHIHAVSQITVRRRAYTGSFVAPENSAVADTSSTMTELYPAQSRLALPCIHCSDFPEAHYFLQWRLKSALAKYAET